MFKLNGSFFIAGGAHINAVRSISESSKLSEVWSVVWDAEQWLDATLNQNIFRLKTSLPAAQNALAQVRVLKTQIESSFHGGGFTEDEVGAQHKFALSTAWESFDTLLRAEMAVSDFYFVDSKGCFDTSRLIDEGIKLFPEDLPSKVPAAIPDCESAGRCIAFDLPTAAAFHLHRINETVLRAYFSSVAPNATHPEKLTIRAYVDAMKNLKLGNKVVQGALSTLNSLHRNPVMHPDQHLESVEEAIALVGSVNACVTHMLREIQPPPLILESPPGGLGIGE